MASNGVQSGQEGAPAFPSGDAPASGPDLEELARWSVKRGNALKGTTAERTAWAYPVTGQMWYDTTLSALMVYTGSGWGELVGAPGASNVTLETGWQNQDQTLKVTRRAGIGFLTGRVSRASGTSTKVGTMATGYRPAETTHASLVALGSAATDGARFIVTANANGDITVAYLSGSPTWNSGSWLPINMAFPLA